jgi:hypothetical protein
VQLVESFYASDVVLDAARAAYEALMSGDVEPLVGLVDPELEWRGRRSARRLWRNPPS